MRLKKVIIHDFPYKNSILKNIEILFDPTCKEITNENFNSELDDFYLEDITIYMLETKVKSVVPGYTSINIE
jgi:hypothetical protein